MEIIFARSKNIELIFFYLLERTKIHGFGSEKNSKNMNIIFASLKTFKEA